MPDDLLSRAFRVISPKAAAVFSDPLRRRIVLLPVERTCSLTEMSAMSRIELRRLHYHVSALVELGLIVVAGRRTRAGRPIKLYRAVACAFFVPDAVMAEPPGTAMAAELREAQARLSDPWHEGILYTVTEKGQMRMQSVRARGAPQAAAAVDCWRIVRLSQFEARRLAEDMDACLKAAATRSRGTTQPYIVHFAFAPRKAS